VAANFFTVAGATSVSNAADSGVITAVFPSTSAATINIAAIAGVIVPVTGRTPNTTITENAQYSGTVTWSPNHSTFAAATQYTATITLTPKTGYTLTGVAKDSFTVAEATSVSNAANSGVITAVFPSTSATTVNIAGIQGVTAPVTGATPITAITENAQYTGTVTWNGNPSTFAAVTQYTATITLTPKTGYTLQGVAANFFTVAGATATNAANSGVITAVFPKDEWVTAQWARTVSAGSGNSYFMSVAVDSSGNVYAAGYQEYDGIFTYGTGVSAKGTASGSFSLGHYNIVLVKYNSSGVARWARTVSTGSYSSVFNSVAVDSSGNVYAAGYQNGNGDYTYGSGVTAKGIATSANSANSNVVLVKYDSNGTAQWARTVSAGSGGSAFNSVAVDSSGNVYAAGPNLVPAPIPTARFLSRAPLPTIMSCW